MWVYYSSQTLFLGAEFTRAFTLKNGGKVRIARDAEFITIKETKADRRHHPASA